MDQLLVGRFPFAYQHVAQQHKSDAEIYTDLDAFTWEKLADSGPDELLSWVVVPPLRHGSDIAKGILFTYGADYLYATAPEIYDYFSLVVTSRWCSIPWSRNAPGLFSVYDNPQRRDWFYRQHPDRRHQVLIPFQEADWTDEQVMRPVAGTDVEYDFICVSRLTPFKNLPFLAEAASIYRQKHGPVRILLVNGYTTNFSELGPEEKSILSEMRSVNPFFDETFTLHEYVPWNRLPYLYARARAFVLTSLIEGKNRALHEAMCCDLPVLLPREFNQYARGPADCFPPGAGLVASYDAELFADGMYRILQHRPDLHPRDAYLAGFSGLQRVRQASLEAFMSTDRFGDEAAILERVAEQYGKHADEFLYGRNQTVFNRALGDDQHAELVNNYRRLLRR